MQSSSPSPGSQPPPLETPALERLQALLRQPLRISINDGRVFLGTFAGTDKPLNILLANTEEFKMGMGDILEGRYVGQVLIPWRLVTKVEAQSERVNADNAMYL